MGTESFAAVTPADDIAEEGLSCFQVAGRAIVICRKDGAFFALKNECSHALSSFEDGRVKGYRLFCPLHGAAFDIRDGTPVAAPAKRPIQTYPLRVVDGVIEIEISSVD